MLMLLTRLLALCLALLAFDAPNAQVQDSRVIGGHNASEGDWPFQTLVVSERGVCGGTLIAPNWVVTAAHCTTDDKTNRPIPAEAFTLRIGSIYPKAGGEMHTARRVVTHEGFAFATMTNDIALIELDTPSRQRVVPLEGVTLPTQAGRKVKADASPWATVIGWGRMVPITGGIATVLQQASLPLVDVDRCNQALSPRLQRYGPIDQRRICAGLTEGGVDSCNGDSGGPLLISDGDGGWAQVGVVSYGEPNCGAPNSFGIYTRISSFADWIGRSIGMAVPPPPSRPTTSVLGAPAAAPTVMAEAAKERGDLAISMSRRNLRIGDSFVLEVRSSFDGYLVLFDLNAKNQLTQLFPNPRSEILAKKGFVRGGAAVRLPDATYGFEFRAADPRGRGRILALAVSDPAMLAGIKAGDGFRTLEDPEAVLAQLERTVRPVPATRDGVRKWGAAFTDYVIE